ncbi:uncharacterized protein F54H12.2-like [Mytilus edulis]|uniref:Uncharacterized protein n=1 Tax=Mytilus edulis TaxID=6550 RepID=A0A8S3UIJ5_MYTED|nr:unnamed protein product [Mytilus edulis]
MASFTTDEMQEAQPSGLDIFSIPPYQTAVERMYYQDVRTNSQLSGNTPLEFNVSGQNGLEYVDLKRTKLYVKAKIKKADGSSLTETEYVGPVNLFLHAMFAQVDVTLQGKLISTATNQYPYKAMIQTLLSYGSDAKKTQLGAQLWKKDTPGYVDANDVKGSGNQALYERFKLFAGSKTCDMEGPLLNDLCSIDRFIVNQVPISVKLYRSRPDFCLVTAEENPNFEVVIEDIVLKVCKLQINPAVIVAHAQKLQSTNARYPFTKSQIIPMNIPSGTLNINFPDLFLGSCPARVVIGFVDAEAAAGSYITNPFNFEHFNLKNIGLYVNNIPVSGNILQINFDATTGQTIIPAYTKLFQITEKESRDSGNQITREDFAKGYALYCFELEPEFGESAHYLTLLKQGNVRLEAQFGTALSKAITCFIYSEQQGMFGITATRTIEIE